VRDLKLSTPIIFTTLLELVVTRGTLKILKEPLLVDGLYLHLRLVEGFLEELLMVQCSKEFLEVSFSRGVA
jgi:hypothetical protein